jgi:hypothetical protein
VNAAVDELHSRINELRTAETNAGRYFNDSVLSQPVEDLVHRLTHVHRGWRKLLRPYRMDKQLVASVTLPHVSEADAIANLAARGELAASTPRFRGRGTGIRVLAGTVLETSRHRLCRSR